MSYVSHRHEVLKYSLKLFKSKGYKFVTVAECLGQKPYVSISLPKRKDVSKLVFLGQLASTVLNHACSPHGYAS